MNTKRLFLAIEIDDEVKKEIQQLVKGNEQVKINWKEPQNSHLTLVFLGNILTSDIAEIINITEDVCLKNQDFVIKLNGLGFLNRKGKKILYIDVDHPKKTEDLHQDLVDALGKYIEKRRNRKFLAHVTIAKFDNKKKIQELIKDYKDHSFGNLKIEKITLFESDLAGEKPKYNPIHSFYLKSTI